MLERLLQRGHVVAARPVGRVDRAEADGDTVIEQVLEKQQRMVALLLRLHAVPVFKAVETGGCVVVGKVQIEIGGVKLLIDLLVDELGNGCVHGGYLLNKNKNDS